MNNNDCFRWQWNKEQLKERAILEEEGALYSHMCKICIARTNGKGEIVLVDLYRSSCGKKVRPNEVELNFLGNMSDFDDCSRQAYKYYDARDIMDLSHPNRRGGVMLRKGAEKSRGAIDINISNEINLQNHKIMHAHLVIDQLIQMRHEPDLEKIFFRAW